MSERYKPYRVKRGKTEAPNNETSTNPANDREYRITALSRAVFTQEGAKGELVLVEFDSPLNVLQTAAAVITRAINVKCVDMMRGEYALYLNKEEMLRGGPYMCQKIAKQQLIQKCCHELTNYCFYIQKKNNFENVKSEDLNKKPRPKTTNVLLNGLGASKVENNPECKVGSKAYQIMLKMGWGGKGLGAQEQGIETPLQPAECIDRKGFGSHNILPQIEKIVREFSKSAKLSTLAFDPSFSKEERVLIHKMAMRYRLKSKSREGPNGRFITISRKLSRYDLVRALLECDCEDDNYILHIPTKFKHLWYGE